MKPLLKIPACLALSISFALHCGAGTLTDTFSSNVDYLANGVSGTIWDGVYLGAEEFANTANGAAGPGATLQCDANITSANTLTVRSTATAWEFAEDDGFFLYKVLSGDFSAVVRIVTPYDNGSFNTAGLMARAFSPGGNPLNGSENYVSWTRFDQFNIGNYFRNAVNGGTDRRTKPAGSNYWLRLDRVGNTFTAYERATVAGAWTLMDTQVRNDFAGLPVQIGIIHATFDVEREARFADFSITADEFDGLPGEPAAVTGLSVSSTTNSAEITWEAAPGSAGTLVSISTGSAVAKQIPLNGVSYSGNTSFGLGDQLLATNYFVVHAGTGTNVKVTNLPSGTAFNVFAHSYTGAGATRVYSRSPDTETFFTPTPPAEPDSNIEVDPVSPTLINYTSLGEWNSNGDFEGWTLNQTTNATVSGGVLSGLASGTDSFLSRLNMVGGADLDLGFNDYLELRVQVPVDYTGDILIYHGNTFYPGINQSRVLTIPSVMIPKDGAFHTYRIDVGLEVYWRAFLRDLRVDLLDESGAGKAFAIDYIRVGDLSDEIYLPRYTSANPAPGQLHELGRAVIDMESKHFRLQWDSTVAADAAWTPNTARGTLRNLEESWQVYVKHLGYREPAESWTVGNRNGNKYKVNMSTWHSGYWAGGDSGDFGRLNITPDGLRVDPPTWVIPHEVMHVFQMHQRDNGSTVDGTWWEGHANYGRELWISYYRNLFPNDSGIDANYIHSAHMVVAHGRDYYLSWPFFVYLDENPDGLPDLGAGIVADIWKNNLPGVYPYNTIEQVTPVTSLKDIVGYFARRELTFDYENQSAINNALNSQNPTVWKRFQLSELVRRADDTNWWRVPMQMAPMQGAYATHELIPEGSGAGRVVTVNFRGLPDAARGADWRASFIVINDSGTERYTPLWSAGSNSVTLAANENRVYVTVAGAPDSFPYPGHNDLQYPYRSHPSKQRLHYEMQVFGAAPKESNNGGNAGLIQHANGGGWKSPSASVDATAYIGPNARVLESAQVRNTARVEDYAVVRGNAQVRNSAVVSGHALVWGSAQVLQSAKVRDWAIVSGSAIVTSNARVLEHAQIQAGTVTDYATAKGCAIQTSGGLTGGHGIIEGDFMAGRTVTNGVAFGHQPFTGVPDNWVRTLADRLYAQYEFASPNQSMIRDQTGVTDGYTVGSPVWSGNLDGRGGLLSFNGADQYVVLDKSLSDTKSISVTAWVRWMGGASNQPVWHFGSAADKGMFFTPDDGTGHAKFVIRNGGTEHVLTASSALPTGVWTHVTVTVLHNVGFGVVLKGHLYINGVLQEENNLTITPDQLNAPNTATGSQHNYLARGADESQPLFNGAIDGVRVYTKALTDAEVAALAPANQAPVLASISNFATSVGVPLSITNSVTDSGLPWQSLTFSLDTAPAGAAIDADIGVFSWRPSVSQAGVSHQVTVRVTDNGAPPLIDTETFAIEVNPVAEPVMSLAEATNGVLSIEVNGDFGPDYLIQTSTNLVDWTTVFSTNSPALPFVWSDPESFQRLVLFYRLLLQP